MSAVIQQGQSNGLHVPGKKDAPDTDPVSGGPRWNASQPRVTTPSGVVAPPDGGYGWAVVFASFCAHMIADGCSLSFGVLFTELLDAFEESKSKTAWVGSLFISMPLICGPFASIIVARYGCRSATMVGGVLSAIGCIASAFVNSIDMLCLTFGVLSGFGLALVFIPAVLVVAFYFDRKRSVATGIAVAGSGIGTFIFAPLTEILIQEYSWRGALLITGGIMLNLVVCGAIFRPLPEPFLEERPNALDSRNAESLGANRTSFISSDGSLEEVDDQQYGDPYSVSGDQQSVSLSQGQKPLSQSLVLLPTYFNGSICIREIQLLHAKKRGDRLMSEGHSESKNGNLEIPTVKYGVNSHDSGVTALDNSSSEREDRNTTVSIADGQEAGNPASIVPVDGSLASTDQWLRFYRNEVFFRHGLLQARFRLARGHLCSCPNLHLSMTEEESFPRRLKGLFSYKRFVDMLRTSFDLSIFKSAIFNYFCLHSLLLYMSYNNPYIYIPDKAAQHNIADDSASTLVSIIGISSTVGQVVMGFIGDRPRVDTMLFYAVMTSIAGLVMLLVPLFTSFPLLAMFSTLYGFFISANYALTSVILVDILGIQQLTSSFGVVSSAGGFAVLFGPPFAGWISDRTGSYESTFYISGIIILVSGCMLFAVPCLKRQRCSRPPSQSSRPKTVVINDTATHNTQNGIRPELAAV